MANEKPKILFVDDEDSIRTTLAQVLSINGFEVTSAATVPEALLFREKLPSHRLRGAILLLAVFFCDSLHCGSSGVHTCVFAGRLCFILDKLLKPLPHYDTAASVLCAGA